MLVALAGSFNDVVRAENTTTYLTTATTITITVYRHDTNATSTSSGDGIVAPPASTTSTDPEATPTVTMPSRPSAEAGGILGKEALVLAVGLAVWLL